MYNGYVFLGPEAQLLAFEIDYYQVPALTLGLASTIIPRPHGDPNLIPNPDPDPTPVFAGHSVAFAARRQAPHVMHWVADGLSGLRFVS